MQAAPSMNTFFSYCFLRLYVSVSAEIDFQSCKWDMNGAAPCKWLIVSCWKTLRPSPQEPGATKGRAEGKKGKSSAGIARGDALLHCVWGFHGNWRWRKDGGKKKNAGDSFHSAVRAHKSLFSGTHRSFASASNYGEGVRNNEVIITVQCSEIIGAHLASDPSVYLEPRRSDWRRNARQIIGGK